MPRLLFVILSVLLCTGMVLGQNQTQNNFAVIAEVTGNEVAVSSFLLAPCLGSNIQLVTVDKYEKEGAWQFAVSFTAEAGAMNGGGKRVMNKVTNMRDGVYRIRLSVVSVSGKPGCVVGTREWPVNNHQETVYFVVGRPEAWPNLVGNSNLVFSLVTPSTTQLLISAPHKVRVVAYQDFGTRVSAVSDNVVNANSNNVITVLSLRTVGLDQSVPLTVYTIDMVTGVSNSQIVDWRHPSRPGIGMFDQPEPIGPVTAQQQ